jgi:hypothetical protein
VHCPNDKPLLFDLAFPAVMTQPVKTGPFRMPPKKVRVVSMKLRPETLCFHE